MCDGILRGKGALFVQSFLGSLVCLCVAELVTKFVCVVRVRTDFSVFGSNCATRGGVWTAARTRYNVVRCIRLSSRRARPWLSQSSRKRKLALRFGAAGDEEKCVRSCRCLVDSVDHVLVAVYRNTMAQPSRLRSSRESFPFWRTGVMFICCLPNKSGVRLVMFKAPFCGEQIIKYESIHAALVQCLVTPSFVKMGSFSGCSMHMCQYLLLSHAAERHRFSVPATFSIKFSVAPHPTAVSHGKPRYRQSQRFLAVRPRLQ